MIPKQNKPSVVSNDKQSSDTENLLAIEVNNLNKKVEISHMRLGEVKENLKNLNENLEKCTCRLFNFILIKNNYYYSLP